MSDETLRSQPELLRKELADDVKQQRAHAPNMLAQKAQDVVAHIGGNISGLDGIRNSYGFFVRLQKIYAIRTNAQVLLKLAFDAKAELVG